MDGLKLLSTARAAGLRVSARGEDLVVRGPRRAQELARSLLRNKTRILPLLQRSSQVRDTKKSKAAEIVPTVPVPASAPPPLVKKLEDLDPGMSHEGGHAEQGRTLRIAEPSVHVLPNPCWLHPEQRWWRPKERAVWTCEQCHPPAIEDVVRVGLGTHRYG